MTASKNELETLDQKFCNDVARLLRPIISLRLDELPQLKATLSPAEQSKLDAAMDIHRSIIEFTNNNRYFQSDKIEGTNKWKDLAQLLHNQIEQHKECLQATTKVKQAMSLTVPVAHGAVDKLQKLSSLVKIDSAYQKNSLQVTEDNKVALSKEQLQNLRNSGEETNNKSGYNP